MSLTDITTIAPNDLDAIQTVAAIAHRLPEMYSLRLEQGTVHLHVGLADARWLGPLLGLGEPVVTSKLAANPYTSLHDGAPMVEITRYEWADEKFTVLGMDQRPVFEPADCEAVQ